MQKCEANEAKRQVAKTSYINILKEKELNLRERAAEIDQHDKERKQKLAADEIERRKARFTADQENFALQASKEGEAAKKLAVSTSNSADF